MSQILPCTPERLRLQASDSRFFTAFQGSYQTFREHTLTEDTIYSAFHRIYRDPLCSPRWKAGRIAGWFAALYHVPCRFSETAPIPSSHRLPRAIEFHITDRQFPTWYRAGYWDGNQRAVTPLTDDELWAVLDQAFMTYAFGRQSLTAFRSCAGYLAGWFAGFYGIRSLIDPSLVAADGRQQPREVQP